MKVLVTGAAGFIGFHTVQTLLEMGHSVWGIDNLNDYYDVELKYARLEACGIARSQVRAHTTVRSHAEIDYRFCRLDIIQADGLDDFFREGAFDAVVHLAAQVGVRYSLENPQAYIQSNLVGFANVLECCRRHRIVHLIYASSSSIYGDNDHIPFSENDRVDRPVSLYAATKRSNELMAYTYSHLYGLKTTGLRFFTVYGPWGRPDMAMFLFTDAILKGKPLKVFNRGDLYRDFTYVDDVVGSIRLLLDDRRDKERPLYNLYNVGNSTPVRLLDFIESIEKHTGKKAVKTFLPMQPGDVEKTWANVDKLKADFGYRVSTDVDTGVKKFIDWYLRYYGVTKCPDGRNA